MKLTKIFSLLFTTATVAMPTDVVAPDDVATTEMAQPDIIVGQLIKVDQFRGQFIFMKSAGCINVTEAISGYIIWPRKMAWIFHEPNCNGRAHQALAPLDRAIQVDDPTVKSFNGD